MTAAEPNATCSACTAGTRCGLVCPECGRLQPVRDPQDYLGFLGFDGPRVDLEELERRYYALSRLLHPDRFAGGSAEDILTSVRAAATLNAAYRTLRDPEARGRWWLGRIGGKLGGSDASLSPELAGLVFAAQEAIDEAGRGDPAARAAVLKMTADVAEHRARGLANLDAILARCSGPALESGGLQKDRRHAAPVREELRAVLTELSYLRTLERDLQRATAADGVG